MTFPAFWHAEGTAALVNHLWQSTVVVGIAWLLALALRKNQARVRYWVWMAASAKFLLPFSLLMAAGEWLRTLMPATAVARPAVANVMEQVAQPFPQTQLFDATAPVAAQRANWLPTVLLAIWACGVLFVAIRFARGWWKVYAARRAALPLALAADVPVLSSPSLIEPGIFGIFRPVLLMPVGILKRLTPEQLRGIVAHEMCHVRRRDNLTFAIHMVVEMLFWFYPAVWWIGARLIEERERACDEAVVAAGGAAQIYAEGILNVCKFYVESPLACVAGVTGANLSKRIRFIMSHRFVDIGWGKRLLLAALALSVVAGPVAFGFVQEASPASQILHAAGPLPSFEVATIKPDHSGSGFTRFGAAGHGAPLDRFIATNASIRKLMGWAFAGNSLPLPDYEVSGGPNWIDSDRYDIDAKLEDSQVAELQKLSDTDRILQVRRMVQGLLADRFKLVVNDTTETRPVYALVIAKGGLRMKETTPCSAPPPGFVPPPPPPPPPGPSPVAPREPATPTQPQIAGRLGDFAACELPVKGLVRMLQLSLDRPIVDQTGLTGNYSFELKWTPDFNPPGATPGASPGAEAPPSDASGPSIFTAIQEQLGLKLEPTKGPVETLEIVHIEKPSAN